MPSVPINALTVDVEDYFQVTAFDRVVSPHEWDRYPLRVGDNTRRILDLFDRFGVKGTFFVLGWVAQRDPALVREIRRRGHEIASHGYDHQLIYRNGPEAFRLDIRCSKALLEEITGEPVYGYRAPSYSITAASIWALDILMEEGFVYDSSIFPIRHDIYGMPDAPRFPYQIERGGGTLREFPITTLRIPFLGREFRLPVAGGGYLRLLPFWLIRRSFRHINRREKQPVVFYVHPWEVDPDQPRISAPLKSRFRHYTNLKSTMGKIEQLLKEFPFAPMREVLGC